MQSLLFTIYGSGWISVYNYVAQDAQYKCIVIDNADADENDTHQKLSAERYYITANEPQCHKIYIAIL